LFFKTTFFKFSLLFSSSHCLGHAHISASYIKTGIQELWNKYSFSVFSVCCFWFIIPVHGWEFLRALHPFAVYSCTVHLSLFYFLCGKSPHILYFLNIMFFNVFSVYFHNHNIYLNLCLRIFTHYKSLQFFFVKYFHLCMGK
jgi:hypothetical protein